MASNYTCRACTRALSRPSSLFTQAKQAPRTPSLCINSRPQRCFATAAPERPQRKPAVAKSAPSISGRVAQTIREQAPLLTETYVAQSATEDLFNECARPGDYTIPQALDGGEIPTDAEGVHLGVGKGWWYEELGLTPTFNNWGQITFIHMYMLQVRFRMFPETHAPIWIQHLTNHAFYGAEDRLAVLHKFTAPSLRQKYLKDMFSRWRAVLLSYDEGLVKGDAVLAAALWRNLFAGRQDVDFQKLAQVVGYMRREIERLDKTPANEIAQGQWKFQGDPGTEAELVKMVSPSMQSLPSPKRP